MFNLIQIVYEYHREHFIRTFKFNDRAKQKDKIKATFKNFFTQLANL